MWMGRSVQIYSGGRGRMGFSPPMAPGVTIKQVDEPDGTLRIRAVIAMLPVAVVTGTVTDSNGVPMVNAHVQFVAVGEQAGARRGRQTAQQMVTATTNDLGEYRTARLEPGSYFLRAGQGMPGAVPDRTLRMTYYPRVLDMAQAKAVAVTAGQVVRADVQILRLTGVKISGRVDVPVDPSATGARRKITQLMLISRDEPMPGAVPVHGVARNDSYEVPEVLPGRYTLLAAVMDQSLATVGLGKPLYGLAREVEVGDKDLPGVDLELRPLPELRGTVTFDEGCPAQPMRINLSGRHMFGRIAEVVSGADGSFVIPDAGPGRYTVSAWAAGNSSYGARVSGVALGDKAVSAEGFLYPSAGNEALNLRVGCGSSGRW